MPPAATEAMQPLYLLALLVLLDVWKMRKGFRLVKLKKGYRIERQVSQGPQVDHISHLAGYGAGIVAAGFLKPDAKTKQRNGNVNMLSEPVM